MAKKNRVYVEVQPTFMSLQEPTRLLQGWLGWLGPLAVTLIGAILRFPGLGTPRTLMFDETYYAKDALALLNYGYERSTIQGADQVLLDSGGHNYQKIFTENPSFVVHPPLGKWIIAFGENLFGATPYGWRIMMAVLGTLSILVTARIARRLTHSDLLGTLAGLLLALDGLHIVMSRTALLDLPLSFFVLCAFGCLIADRDTSCDRFTKGIPIGIPWWRLGMASFLGLALATKWSALYFIGAFVILSLAWNVQIKRTNEIKNAAGHMIRWFISMVGTAAIIMTTYLTSWAGWFSSTNAWDRTWANGQPKNIFPNTLRSLWHYHFEMYNFHVHLNSPHNYRAGAWGWPILARPTSFFYESKPTCGATTCSQEVIPLGNPLIWWAGAAALLFLLYLAMRRKHSAATALLTGFAAGWVPWLFFPHRTTFHFYSVAFIPFTVMALALALGYLNKAVMSEQQPDSDQSAGRQWIMAHWPIVAFVSVVAMFTVFFAPIYYAHSIPYQDWNLRMWFKSWI